VAALVSALVIAPLPVLLAGLLCAAPREVVVGSAVPIAIGILGLYVLARVVDSGGLPRAWLHRRRRRRGPGA
jgi:hypothetical protein